MAKPKRQRIEPTHPWEQLALRLTSPEQHTDELIRPSEKSRHRILWSNSAYSANTTLSYYHGE